MSAIIMTVSKRATHKQAELEAQGYLLIDISRSSDVATFCKLGNASNMQLFVAELDLLKGLLEEGQNLALVGEPLRTAMLRDILCSDAKIAT